MPCSARWNFTGPMSNFIEAIRAIDVNKIKYAKIRTLLDRLFQSLINSIFKSRNILSFFSGLV